MLKEDVDLKKIRASVVKPLTMLRVAEHNGCHILRPKEYIGFDDPEDPQTLKTLIEATGATCLDYIDETECQSQRQNCAATHKRQTKPRKKWFDAQALIMICPFCHIMYNTNELRIEKMFNEVCGIPILHYPQLLELAMGHSTRRISLQ